MKKILQKAVGNQAANHHSVHHCQHFLTENNETPF